MTNLKDLFNSKTIKTGIKIGNSKLYKIGDDLFNIFETGRIELINKVTLIKIGKITKLENKEFILVDKGWEK